MKEYLEVVSYGEEAMEYFGVFNENTGPVGPVHAVWEHTSESGPYWKNVETGLLSTRNLILTSTLRHMGICLKSAVGDRFDHKAFSGDAWAFYRLNGFMI